jgi:hypothetical protein
MNSIQMTPLPSSDPGGSMLGNLLVAFQHRPSLLKMPRIFLNALLG